MKSVAQLMEEAGDLRANPAAVQRVVLNAMDQMLEGEYELVDPSNPFVFLLESATATAAAGMQRSEGLMRRIYPTLAQTEEEIYPHMSDADFPNRFASPGRTTMTLLMSLPEIRERAIDDGTGVRKLTIPRDTDITVEGLTFTLQYPIEIRVLPHGGVQAVYDVSQTSPLQTLESNLLEWDTGRMSASAGELAGIEFLIVKIPMLQFKLTPHYDQLNPSSGFAKSYSFTEQFYHARVYISSGVDGEWEEIHTTHSEQVYDPTKPTAKLKVIGQRLDVSVPQIYFSRGMLPRGVRVDIYTTRGPVDVPLERYEPRSFQARWRDLSKHESPFVAPIRSFTTLTLFSTERVQGGSSAIDFETLRERVINNALGEISVPITPAQLEAQMDTLGYRIVKDVDNITNRVYLAMRDLPRPENNVLATPIGCTVGTLQEALSNLAPLADVHDNGRRVTLASGMLFNVVRGILSPLDNYERQALMDANPESRVQRVNENNYAFTPFHYVLDTNDDHLEVRAYHLDAPEIYTKKFVGENQTTRLAIATHRYGIDKTESGYKIALITRCGAQVQAFADDRILAQLSFIPEGEVDRAYLNGEFAGRTENGDFIFEFHLSTNFDVDANDRLLLDTFLMYDTETRTTPIDLDAAIDVQYIAVDYDVDGLKPSELDTRKGQFLLPEGAISVVQETLNVRFGRALDGLWRRSRSVASSLDYARYESDIPATYESVVYKRDPQTGVIDIQRDPETGELIYEVLHNVGDPVLDGDGLPVYKHRKGDVKLDNDGQPISVDSRRMLRQADLLLLEGSFAFATDRAIQQYTRQVTRTVVDWVTQDIAKIQTRMLENTQLWYYPQTTLGSVRVYVEDGVPTSIEADQSFKVKFYMTRIGYDNVELRGELTRVATAAISEGLKKTTVSITDMARQIRENVGDDVLDVVVSVLGGENDYEMLSLQDDATHLGIRKRLEVLPNGDLSVQDDVAIEFVRHRDA